MADQILHRPHADIAYQLTGEGPLLVYGHGMPLSRASEDGMGLIDWGRVTGRAVLRYDARGHGRSTGRAEPADYTWRALSDDLLALLDHVGATEPVDAMGSSMGVGTLLWAAVRAPERFRRLVLVIPSTAWQTRPAMAANYRAGADAVERLGVAAFVTAMRAAPRPEIMGDWSGYPPAVGVSDELLPSVLRGAADSDYPAEADVAALTHPTLLLPWATDPGHPVSTSERLAELLPNSELHVATTLDDARTWADRALAFLS